MDWAYLTQVGEDWRAVVNVHISVRFTEYQRSFCVSIRAVLHVAGWLVHFVPGISSDFISCQNFR